MKINLQPGKYIIAVSGGVDSVVLLNVLSKLSELELVVAHFDHGIREDSYKDRVFVEELADSYGLSFVAESTSLGEGASEDKARSARYKFLFQMMKEYGAHAVVTAHHQDDVLETIIMNLSRGTGRKGLSPMKNRKNVLRPLLDYSKAEILRYARSNNLQWREDKTNQDPKYFRNYVRFNIVPKISTAQKQQLLKMAETSHKRNQEIDELVDLFINQQETGALDREGFAALPHDVASEVLAQVLRAHNVSFDRKNIERLVVGLKTLSAGSQIPITAGVYFIVDKKTARISGLQSV